MPTGISYVDETWNPVVGCTKCSPGCENCYAERMMYRQVVMGCARHEKNPDGNEDAWTAYSTVVDEDTHKWNGQVALRYDQLDKPLHWRQPRRILVPSMGDLFHEKVPFEFILKIIGVSMATPWHKYLFLTKRIDRILLFNQWWKEQWKKSRCLWGKDSLALQAVDKLPTNLDKATKYWEHNFDQSGRGVCDYPIPYPQPNIHLGVTICNQKEADEKIPILLQIPAVHRWVSAEPLLGEIDLRKLLDNYYCSERLPHMAFIDWVVVGGESGPNARPMHPDWVRSIRDQCIVAGVPFFFKQWGAWLDSQQFSPTAPDKMIGYKGHNWRDGHTTYKVGKKKAGRLLDGKEWNQYPE